MLSGADIEVHALHYLAVFVGADGKHSVVKAGNELLSVANAEAYRLRIITAYGSWDTALPKSHKVNNGLEALCKLYFRVSSLILTSTPWSGGFLQKLHKAAGTEAKAADPSASLTVRCAVRAFSTSER